MTLLLPNHQRYMPLGSVYTGLSRDVKFEVGIQATKDDAGEWAWRPVVLTSQPGQNLGITYGTRADYLTPALALALSALLTEATDLARSLPAPTAPEGRPEVRDTSEPEAGMPAHRIRSDERRQVVAELEAYLAERRALKVGNNLASRLARAAGSMSLHPAASAAAHDAFLMALAKATHDALRGAVPGIDPTAVAAFARYALDAAAAGGDR